LRAALRYPTKSHPGRLIDISGRRFGAWVAVSQMPANDSGQTRWLCICDCGTFRGVVGVTLRNGTSVSCGCTKPERLRRIKTTHGTSRQTQGDLRWARQVKERDAHVCQMCRKQNLSGKSEHAHHLKSVKLFPELRYELDNGQTLCSSCHRGQTNREVAYGAARR
jgi:5-methylcytosine-specific restriction endonuclease McrA